MGGLSIPQLKVKFVNNIWKKVFKTGLSKICGRQLLKKFEVI